MLRASVGTSWVAVRPTLPPTLTYRTAFRYTWKQEGRPVGVCVCVCVCVCACVCVCVCVCVYLDLLAFIAEGVVALCNHTHCKQRPVYAERERVCVYVCVSERERD